MEYLKLHIEDLTGISLDVITVGLAALVLILIIIMIVNGQQETLETPISVTELIEQRGLRPERVAIELNGDIVPRNKRSEVMLHDGDTVEIVTFVQGG